MSAQPARSGLHLVEEWPPGPPSGPGLPDNFALWMRANGYTEATIRSRFKHIEDFTRHNPSFPFVKPMHISAWLGREGLAPWSRATYFGALRCYFNFAMENGLIEVDPMERMRRPRAVAGKPRPLTPAQVDIVLTASASSRNTNIGAWLTLALFAGLRAFEIAKIRGEDVTQDDIHVIGKGTKAADVPTHPVIWTLAADRPRTGWWFPSSRASLGHVRASWVSGATAQLFTDCGIEGSIHRARHTYATTLLRSGANIRVVQELMRHDSLHSTAIYTAVDEDERRAAIAALQPYGTRVSAAGRCSNGHEYTEANSYMWKGLRLCRECHRTARGAR